MQLRRYSCACESRTKKHARGERGRGRDREVERERRAWRTDNVGQEVILVEERHAVRELRGQAHHVFQVRQRSPVKLRRRTKECGLGLGGPANKWREERESMWDLAPFLVRADHQVSGVHPGGL